MVDPIPFGAPHSHGGPHTHGAPYTHGGPHPHGGPPTHGGSHTQGGPQLHGEAIPIVDPNPMSAIPIVHKTIVFDAGL